MLSESARVRSILVLSAMILGLVILYPKLLHVMVLYLLGINDEYKDKNEFVPSKIRKENNIEIREDNSINYAKVRDKSRSWAFFIPIYGIMIFLFFLYNINKMTFFSKSKTPDLPRDSWLKTDISIDGGKYYFNGLTRAEIDSCNGEEIINDDLDSNPFNREEIMKLIEKVQDENLNGKQIGEIFCRLQQAETKLVDMMGKVRNIHSSFADISNTINCGQFCSKSLLEDEEIEPRLPNKYENDEVLYTASEGEN